MEIIAHSAKVLQREVNWFEAVVDTALTLYFKNESQVKSVFELTPPALEEDEAPYSKFVKEHELSFEERLVLILSLIPHIKPQCLDVFLIRNQNLNSEFSEFGGVRDANKSGFLPTLETACFILEGHTLLNRFQFVDSLHKESILYHIGVLEYDAEKEFGLRQELKISTEYLSWFTTGNRHLPQYSSKFPAKEITTQLEWDDLILDAKVKEDLAEIKDWLIHSETILKDWKLDRKLKEGFRVLFYGPPGTGKTLAATLIGKETDRPVFRVDLSMVVSKYIGETEKNLGQLFDVAEHKEWVLFFDEADALFGRRTQTKGANDRYANQEVAYLLQRIEDFAGLVILATNIQSNVDEAFSRRFQSMVRFPKPDKKQRRKLWERMFADSFDLADDVDLDHLAENYELSGGDMINVLRYCALEAARRKEKKIQLKDIMRGIRREYRKSNKTL